MEELQQDGQEGRKKIAEITRYVTVGLALIQSTAMSIGFGRSEFEFIPFCREGHVWN